MANHPRRRNHHPAHLEKMIPQITGLPTTGTYDFTVDWGDGSSKQQVTSHNDEHRKHTYTTAGEYTVTITGTLEGFNFQIVPKSKTNLIEVIEWGGIALGTYFGHFTECENLEAFSQTDAPDLSKTQEPWFPVSRVANLYQMNFKTKSLIAI